MARKLNRLNIVDDRSRIDQIRDFLDAAPFRPFTVTVKDGRQFTIENRGHDGTDCGGSNLVRQYPPGETFGQTYNYK